MTSTSPIPSITTATDPIHCAADMAERWRALMGPLGFAERTLWVGFVGPGRRMHKVLSQVPVGRRPDATLIDNLMAGLAVLLDTDFEPATSVALLLTRPGSEPAGAADHRWARLLTEAARRAGVAIEPIFLANDRAIEQL